MPRRLPGPILGPVVFLLFAGLVFGVLGWVTVAALRVEDAQREAAARAELGSTLRLALWRLDGRMLPVLGVEDARPFHHYGPADPLAGNATGPTPLLAAPLPDWMTLHVQLDPVGGWESPQVLEPAACARVNDAWPDFPIRNSTAGRAAALVELRARHPAPYTCDWLGARTGTVIESPAEPPPGIANLSVLTVPPPVYPPKPPPPTDLTAEKPNGPFRLFGWSLEAGDRVTLNDAPPQKAAEPQAGPGSFGGQAPPAQPAPPPVQQTAPGKQQAANPQPAPSRVVRGGRDDLDNRTQVIQRAQMDAKNASQEFPQFNSRWFNGVPAGPPGDTNNGRANSASGLVLDQFALIERLDREFVEQSRRLKTDGEVKALAKKFNDEYLRQRDELARAWQLETAAGWSGRVAAACRELECRPPDDAKKGERDKRPPQPPAGPKLVPPAEERPLPLFANPGGTSNSLNWLSNNVLVGPPATHIHLGSMRPVWLPAPDGSDALVLVRAARLDTKTVYQGVVLDWPGLEALLKEEIADLFPDARLVPVRDPAAVVPERAMTALPVQLDPGPVPTLPPAGRTPLRIGLTVAWVAGLLALAAIGFSGRALLDLAERRIRFVSAVTHELRTPLTSLRLYLDLLMSGMVHDEAKRHEYLKTLAGESDRLHRLIDNVLDFAKLEKRRANGDMKPVKVADLLDLLRATWADRVALDGKELVVVSTLPAGAEVVTDAAMVQQIVGNLIDNARKYSRDAADNRIWVWAKPGAGGRAVFEVEDRGPGVPPGERKAIFQPFRRGATADTTAGGAGLGLALAKQWAEVLGGALSYHHPEAAPGACFRLELPLK